MIPLVMALFAIPGLLLTSCKGSTDFSSPPVSLHQTDTGLLLDGGEKRVSLLASKLRHNHFQRTHIVIIGDSHTAADFLSGQLRKQFQERFGNGGIGFISPLAVSGNRYSNVSFSNAKGWQLENSRRQQNPAYTLGGNIATPLYDNHQYHITGTDEETRFNVQALYRTGSTATLRLEAHSLPLAVSGGKWKLTQPVQLPASFSVALTGVRQAQLGGFWLTDTRAHGVIVSALGLNGAQISMLDKWQSNWTDTLKLLEPDLIMLAYGTNESFNTDLSLEEYRQTLVRQIRKIRGSMPGAVILLVGPGSSIMRKNKIGCEQRQSPLLKPVIEVQKQVAKSEHTLFWNWFVWMGGDCAIERFAAQDKARPDLIHLTAKGYEESAAALWLDLSKKLKISQ